MHTHVTHCAAVSERKNYNANLSRTPGAPLKQPKKATVKGGTLNVYVALDRGCGMVFIKLSYIESIGCTK